MRIQPFAEGPYGTSCYAVYEYNGNECVIIDAPFPFRGPASFIKENGLAPAAVYLTHGHFDHIFGLAEARRLWPGIPIFIGQEDMRFIENGYRGTISLLKAADPLFLSRYAAPLIDEMPDDLSGYGESADPFTVIPTPGHTPGSVSLWSREEKVIFTGDTLFAGSVGRTDLGGSMHDLLESVRKLKELPPDTLVLPGHGPMTDIGTELSSNPYMR